MNYFGGNVRWTPYGGVLDLEPPEEEIAHLSCWEKEKEVSKQLIYNVSWLKPSITKE